jgi:hypothetical protein
MAAFETSITGMPQSEDFAGIRFGNEFKELLIIGLSPASGHFGPRVAAKIENGGQSWQAHIPVNDSAIAADTLEV